MGRPKSDQCSNGHFWTTASTRWVRPTGGPAYRVCRHCIRARKAILRTRGTAAPRIVPEGATANPPEGYVLDPDRCPHRAGEWLRDERGKCYCPACIRSSPAASERPRPEPVGVIWNGWDLHHPQCPEPEAPIPPLVLFGPWSPPALGDR